MNSFWFFGFLLTLTSMRPLSIILILLNAVLYGCATMINGTTQDVPVDIDEGTFITDTANVLQPLYRSEENRTFIKLKRKQDHILTFRNGSDSVVVNVIGTMEGAYIAANLFTYGVGYIVDGSTGAWFSFDGLSVRFPNKGKKSPSDTNIIAQGYDPFRPTKLGLVVRLGVGILGPFGGNQALIIIGGNSYSLGLGYKLFNDLHIFADYTFAGLLDSHPKNSRYYSYSNLSSYEASIRFYPVSSIYFTAGVGYSHVRTDSLSNYVNYTSNKKESFIPSQGRMGSVVFGVGHSGSIGFIELQARYGTNGFYLSSGERGNLYSFGLRYGLNLTF